MTLRRSQRSAPATVGQIVILLDRSSVPEELRGVTATILRASPDGYFMVECQPEGRSKVVSVVYGDAFLPETITDNDFIEASDTKDLAANRTISAPSFRRLKDSWVDTHYCLIDNESRIDLCVSCSSAGTSNDMILCNDCGEAYHYYCVDIPQESLKRTDWTCTNCMMCIVCGSARDPPSLLQCDYCFNGTHLGCNEPKLDRIPESGFLCPRCTALGVNVPKQEDNDCCPLCKSSAFDNDMVQCDTCDRWVHSNCDGDISSAQYKQLSENPSASYFCPLCRARPHLIDNATLSVPEIYARIRELVQLTQEKRRRSRRRMLLNTSRHLSKNNSYKRHTSYKRPFPLNNETLNLHDNVADDKTESSCDSAKCFLPLDMRSCALCHVVGDGEDQIQSRLIPIAKGQWGHANCLIYSNETFEAQDGSLAKADRAILRGARTKCVYCKEFGATINCCQAFCLNVYHLPCTLLSACTIDVKSNNIYCPDHNNGVPISNHLMRTVDTLRHRIVTMMVPGVVEDHFESKNCSIRVGALSITRLDNDGLGFRSNRIFWSTLRPMARTVYNFEVIMKGVCHVYTIRAQDRPEFLIQSTDPVHAYKALVSAIPGFTERNSIREHIPNGEYSAFGLCASIFFGFGHPILSSALRERISNNNSKAIFAGT